MARLRPFVLCVIDGWGVSERREGNAIELGRTPNMHAWPSSYPYTTLAASSLAVGLPEGQMGNSEVGHLNIGAGFVVYQDSVRISEAIRDGSFFGNPALLGACEHVKRHASQLHLMGLIGPGGVHALSEHLYALLRLAREQDVQRVFVHAFLDGRDTPPQSAIPYMQELLAKIEEIGVGQVASVSGRYYAMDRDKRWERTAKAYRALVFGEGETAPDPITAIEQSYARQITDEFVLPTVIVRDGQPLATVRDNDAVIFFNYRTDRPRQLTRAFVMPDFDGFERGPQLQNLYFVTMTEYEAGLPVRVAFEQQTVKEPLAKVISDAGWRQFHTAETEKYAHVTFFINGGREEPFPGEERKLVPSPKVATYDLKPEMSAYEVTDVVLEALAADRYDVIIMNFANPDMVGHTGVLDAAIKACEVVDECLGRIAAAVLERGGGMLITCDHGNAEQMIDPETGAPHTAHTTNPVPCLLLMPDDAPLRHVRLRDGGKLADVAPTILEILGLPKPQAMTGRSLIVRQG
ncbi:2,3-bisphosphoglycerate-independent phosphoglycerate mutase [Kallotenue papyrolyticum]|uniref:2,3-bisphosphoglycerate-independent phosphoglycerate mutase n=1 Tax=Kallotenue papyrolyticum TaxID=1325125 RepID=UPI0004785F7E|nr:2,3-bisphosphoglycerate-independent phosphoglycerate mutase [Kallotenue papyrolyticum]